MSFAQVELPAPLNDWGTVKGLLSRHLRWWSARPDIFNVDGTLTIGYSYPNMYLSEDYNSPQSPYWAMKSFVVLGLSPEHPFWVADEKTLPADNQLSVPVPPPMQIICHTAHHHFLLSSGQFCPWPLKATEAKYGKFAYSSHFGFSVPTGALIQQIAPDSTLALSKDDGDTWRVPWKVQDFRTGTVYLKRGPRSLEELPTIRSTWKPWKDANIEVHTLLVSPSRRWPEWHVRVHRFKNLGTVELKIQTVQGGFAIQGREHEFGGILPPHTDQHYQEESAIFSRRGGSSFPQGTQETERSALICSDAGSSGITSLITPNMHIQSINGQVLKPDSNTNLLWQRTLIPTIRGTVTIPGGTSTELQSAIFAIARRDGSETKYETLTLRDRWKDAPRSTLSELVGLPESHYVLLPEDW